MEDIVAFIALAAAWTVASRLLSRDDKRRPFLVDKDNEPLECRRSRSRAPTIPEDEIWHRATYCLVMLDPPEMHYEPKEWDHTSVLLCRVGAGHDDDDHHDETLVLPSGVLRQGESYIQCAARELLEQLRINVSQPENSLHHLFTFPFQDTRRWADFMECVYRGSLEDLFGQGLQHESVARIHLGELKDMVNAQQQQSGDGENPGSTDEEEHGDSLFSPDTFYALRLYLQRQGDLRAKRRLMKGYSSADLEHYKLRRESKVIFLDDEDSTRNEALEYTMKTDDGQSPSLLFEADLILLGVSRAGKTPLSLVLSQMMGLKVANIPLVVDMPPPPQLFKVNPRRVFCLTVDESQLKTFRKSRLRREISKTSLKAHKNTYADTSYVRQDLEHAQRMAHEHGFTEINVSGRAIEETASLIASKLRERFPDTEIRASV